jgi:hypothetical protein
MELKINQLERDASDGTVTTVHWTATLIQGEHTAFSYGSIGFIRDEDSSTFIPFDSLTEEIVVGWVTAQLDTDLEASLQKQLEEMITPTSISGIPWAPVEEEAILAT